MTTPIIGSPRQFLAPKSDSASPAMRPAARLSIV